MSQCGGSPFCVIAAMASMKETWADQCGCGFVRAITRVNVPCGISKEARVWAIPL